MHKTSSALWGKKSIHQAFVSLKETHIVFWLVRPNANINQLGTFNYSHVRSDLFFLIVI